MSQTFKKTPDVFALIAAVLFVSTSSAFASPAEVCVNATPLELDSTRRGYASEGTEVFALDIPAAGIVALDVTVSGTAKAEPKLGFLGRGCSTAADPGAATIEKSAASQTIAFRSPGEYYVRLAAQDPRQALESYKLNARFVAAEVVDGTVAMDLGQNHQGVTVRQTDFLAESAAKSGEQGPLVSVFAVYDPDPHGLEDDEVDPDPHGLEDDEVDPDPHGFSGSDRGHGSRGADGLEDDEVDPDPHGLEDDEVDPDPHGLEDDEVDPDPHGVTANGRVFDSVVTSRGRDELCRSSEADDHSEISSCATPLPIGAAVTGRIANGWNDDVDMFKIQLAEPQTVQITTRGNGDTFGGLYDQFGQRLAAADGGGAGSNFRIVKSLDAGVYLVRVEGSRGSEGAYELTAETLDW